MGNWGAKYATNRWIRLHANGVAVHGSAEPLLSILDLRGFEVRDMFVMETGVNGGNVILPTQERAMACKGALEPAYRTTVSRDRQSGDWWVQYTPQNMDCALFTDMTGKDGRQVIKDGRWV